MRTRLGKAEPDRVLVRGRDLTSELLGTVTYTDMVGLILLERVPTEAERRMIDALLVVLVEHGLVKAALSARFVYSHAPEAVQAAVAAGLLGAGSKHLGTSEWTARMLADAVATDGLSTDAPDEDVERAARHVVNQYTSRRRRIPGIGHHTHPNGDPRAVRLFEIARETGTYGVHARLLAAISRLATAELGRTLPINVTGAIGAIAIDLGFRPEITRSFAILGRALGVLGHIQEEMDEPIADEVVRMVADEAEYRP